MLPSTVHMVEPTRSPLATAWAILGAVASGERVGSTMWTVDGNNPFGYLQAHSHEAAATGPDVANAPVYYARAIMSYVAVDRAERVFVAVHLEPHVPGRPYHRMGDPRHAGAP